MKKYFIIALALISLHSCETFELDNELQDPNNLTLEQADPNLLLNSIQIGVGTFFNSSSNIGMNLTRQAVVSGGANGSTYLNTVTPTDFWTDRMWNSYITVIGSSQSLRKTVAGKGFTYHEGMSRVLEAYALLTLVDYFGDIPLSEAIKGSANTNPKVDKGADVYAYAIGLLETAKVNFATTPTSRPKNDLFYPTSASNYTPDAAKWIKLCNSLMFKAYLNTNNTAKLNALVIENNLISTGDDFVFRYGTNTASPDNRNPYFLDSYAKAPDDYMATSFMNMIINEKGTLVDPRRRYYFYRQVLDVPSTANTSTLPCSSEPYPSHFPAGTPFCYLDFGYWGRDMGNGDGIPPDTDKRTVWGVYPFGGKFDTSSGGSVNVTAGQAGVGVAPIMLSNYVDFMKAEAMLRLGVTGDAKATLLTAVTNNLNYVKDLFPQTGSSAMTATQVTNYVTLVSGLYDAASTTSAKLGVIGKEFYLGSFGNGVESYNLYRRTGKPSNLQPMKSATPGAFPSSFMYPSNFTENNSNAVQKPDNNVRVFWDTSNRVLF